MPLEIELPDVGCTCFGLFRMPQQGKMEFLHFHFRYRETWTWSSTTKEIASKGILFKWANILPMAKVHPKSKQMLAPPHQPAPKKGQGIRNKKCFKDAQRALGTGVEDPPCNSELFCIWGGGLGSGEGARLKKMKNLKLWEKTFPYFLSHLLSK